MAADFVVLEQAEAGAGGAHDDRTALADGEAVGKRFFQSGEDVRRNLEPGLRQGLEHALSGRADERDALEVRAVVHENFRKFGEVGVLLGEPMSYQVFSLTGAMLGTVDLTRMDAQAALKAAGFKKGIYMLKQAQGSKKFLVNTTK